jgi:hypothetical protein
MTGQDLQMITSGQAATMAITSADNLTMQLTSDESPLDAYRRCTNNDRDQYQPGMTTLDDPDENPPNDNGYDPQLPTL